MDALPAEIATLPAVLEPPVRVIEPPLRVVAQPSVFREPSSRVVKEMPHGSTLLHLVLEAGMGELGDDGGVHLPGRVVVSIDGHVAFRVAAPDDPERAHYLKPPPTGIAAIDAVAT